MLKRLWSDYRNTCLVTLVLLVIGIVVSPWVLLATLVPVGWVLLNKKPASEDEPLTITEESVMKSESSQNTDEKLTNDRKDVLDNVKQNGYALQYASDDLKADREIVITAVQQNGYALQYASDDLKADREIVLAVVQKDSFTLQYASDDLKADREIVIAAVQQNGYALEYASDDLKADREIVLAAVQQDGLALEYASDDLKADREIVLAAVQQDGDAIDFADLKVKVESSEHLKDQLNNEINTDQKAFILKFTISCLGGSFGKGIIRDSEITRQIINKINNGKIRSNEELDDGSEIAELCNKFAIYGPDLQHANVLIEKVSIEDETEIGNKAYRSSEYKEIYNGSLSLSGINVVEYSPDLDVIKEKEVGILTKKIEHDINYLVELKIEKGNKFDLSDIYVMGICMDDTFDSDETIMQDFLYIPKKYVDEYISSWGDDYEFNINDGKLFWMTDLLRNEYYEENESTASSEYLKKLRNKHLVFPIDIDGGGQWECDYVQIRGPSDTSEYGEVLFEGDNY
tara:strand:- start:134 stop:1684 length:1551 start_codon:yes stop_codon:yes gene_type:complete